VAALSSYENRPISTGILLLGTKDDPYRDRASIRKGSVVCADLGGIKNFYRLADGVHTVFLANSEGRLLDIIDVRRWGSIAHPNQPIQTPCARAFRPHAHATIQHGHVCVVLSPSREVKVFAEGAELFTFRGAAWHLLDLQAKYRQWAEAVGNEALALRIFQTALDLADGREGALFAVIREPSVAIPLLVAPTDRLDLASPDDDAADLAVTTPGGAGGEPGPSRRDLLHLLEGRSMTDLDPSVLAALASLDGAMVSDRTGRLLAAGAILRHPPLENFQPNSVIEGARTTAAMAASRFGPVLKVSEDGVITFFDGERVWDI
jgi:hypothetical protein